MPISSLGGFGGQAGRDDRPVAKGDGRRVRSGLAAGGRWICTSGSALAATPLTDRAVRYRSSDFCRACVLAIFGARPRGLTEQVRLGISGCMTFCDLTAKAIQNRDGNERQGDERPMKIVRPGGIKWTSS